LRVGIGNGVEPTRPRASVAQSLHTISYHDHGDLPIFSALSDGDHCRMTTPRHLLVDPAHECDYHLVSRCVRGALLCGVDALTGRDCSHRRAWFIERLEQLAPCFAVDVYSHSVFSNHFHLVVRHDPLASRGWSDEEVAWRWSDVFPPSEHGAVVQARKPELRELMLGDSNRIARARRTLGSLSDFMKHLRTTQQPAAWKVNSTRCFNAFFMSPINQYRGVLVSSITTFLQLLPVAFRACGSASP